MAKVFASHVTDSDSDGRMNLLEVSTGYWHDGRQQAGSFDGEPYREVQRSLLSDHLAILPNERGACSVNDGCGTPRVNRLTVACASGCNIAVETCAGGSAPLKEKPEQNDVNADGSVPPRLYHDDDGTTGEAPLSASES